MNAAETSPVKALGDGSRLVHAVRQGTAVLAEGPSGAPTANRRSRASVLLIAGGVGHADAGTRRFAEVGTGRLTLPYRASRPSDVVLSQTVGVALREVGLPRRHLHDEVFGF